MEKINLRELYRTLDDIEARPVTGDVSFGVAEEIYRVANYEEPKSSMGMLQFNVLDTIVDPVDYVLARMLVVGIIRVPNTDEDKLVEDYGNFMANPNKYISELRKLVI